MLSLLSGSKVLDPRLVCVVGSSLLGHLVSERLGEEWQRVEADLLLRDGPGEVLRCGSVRLIVNAAEIDHHGMKASNPEQIWELNATLARDLARWSLAHEVALVTLTTTIVDAKGTSRADCASEEEASRRAGELAATLLPRHYNVHITHDLARPQEEGWGALADRLVSLIGRIRDGGVSVGEYRVNFSDGDLIPQSRGGGGLLRERHRGPVGQADPAPWTYVRPSPVTYSIRHKVPSSECGIPSPKFYNRETPPLADSSWPEANAAPRLRLLEYRDAVAYPRHVIVDSASQSILPISFKKHRHHAHNGVRHLGDDRFELRDKNMLNTRIRSVDEPIYLGDTEYPGIYGHDLVEVVAAAWAWKNRDTEAKFATSTRNRPYLVDLLEHAGVSRQSLLFFDGPIASRELLFPEPPIVARRFMHPVAQEVFDQIRDSALARRDAPFAVYPEKIYVSRSRVSERPMLNELEVEEVARESGFVVVHPQDMTVTEQIRLFAHAKEVMGPGGSAMHNVVFAPPDSRVLLLSSEGWVTVIDSLLRGERGGLGYVIGGPADPGQNRPRRNKDPWIVASSDVRSAMRSHFG